MTRRVLVLNQYYEPDVAVTGRHATAIAEALAAAGADVTVVCGTPSYSDLEIDAPFRERREGVDVRRIRLGRSSGRKRKLTRAAGYLRYLAGATRLVMREHRRSPFGAVLAFHNPPFVGLLGAALARGGVRFVYAPHDIHPDILLATSWITLPTPLVHLWEAINRVMLRSASSVVVLGEGMAATIRAKGVPDDRIARIPVWAEPPLAHLAPDPEAKAELGRDADLLAVYAGNMGVMHPLEVLFDALEELERDGAHVGVVLAGGGVQESRWRAEVARRGLGNVRFLPFQRGADYERLMAASDLGLVSLADGMERLAMPSRAFTTLAAGRPLLTLMTPDADLALLGVREGVGWNARSARELAAVLRRLAEDPTALAEAGRRARGIYEERFTREALSRRYVELVLGGAIAAG